MKEERSWGETAAEETPLLEHPTTAAATIENLFYSAAAQMRVLCETAVRAFEQEHMKKKTRGDNRGGRHERTESE